MVTCTGSDVDPTNVGENVTTVGSACSRPGNAAVVGVGRVVVVVWRVGVRRVVVGAEAAVTDNVALAFSPWDPVTSSVPRNEPPCDGIAVTSTSHVAATSNVTPPQAFAVTTNSAPSEPPTATSAIDTATSPVFVTVAVTGPPRAPTVVEGNCN